MNTLFSNHVARVQKAVRWLQGTVRTVPEIAIITGSSGPHALGAHFNNGSKDHDIPAYLPTPTIEGHLAQIRVGVINETPTLWVRGRVHFNECTQDPYRHVTMVQGLGLFGVKNIILTNASGSLSHSYGPGTVCVVSDHNSKFMGHNPLAGDPSLVEQAFKANFHVNMNPVYDIRFRELAAQARYEGTVRAGVRYLMVPGPEFETAMEAQMFEPLTDLVGMSSIPEAMVARQLGMRVLLLSFVTNMISTTVNEEGKGVTHIDNLKVVEEKEKAFARYLAEVIDLIGKESRGELTETTRERAPVDDEDEMNPR